MTTDEGIRWPADKEKMKKLPLLKGEGGRITAALASQVTDGASAVLVVNERGLKKLGLKPRARIVAMALAGDDPGKKNTRQKKNSIIIKVNSFLFFK